MIDDSLDDMMNDKPIDFGTDDDLVPPADPAFDAWIAKVAPTLNAPTAAPRREMWDAIQAARGTEEARGGQPRGVTSLSHRRRNILTLIAATLLLAVALDRAFPRKSDERAAPVASAPAPDKDASDPSHLYRMASAQTLTQAEALLTAFRATDVRQQDPAMARQLGSWGRQVLGSTRLLIDSPAGDDPQLRALLNDLELILVQIIQLSGGEPEPGDRALVDRALEDRDLLPRIRTAVPAGVGAGASAASSE